MRFLRAAFRDLAMFGTYLKALNYKISRARFFAADVLVLTEQNRSAAQ